MAKHVGKRGDTLIEVMLAVGIFSMVAVAVVAVMSGGTSSAQTALETTLTREAIDAQAEALRFIQSSYIAEKDNVNGEYANLWRQITGTATEAASANNVNVVTGEAIGAIAQYSPSECSEMYSNDGQVKQYGFVINTNLLGSEPKNAIISVKNNDNKGLFQEATTYPRLVYKNEGDLDLASDSYNLKDLSSVEGIYIIAVRDPGSTTIAGTNKSAYYDFYIRTCWYGTGDKAPSTISTVMRLYDPGIVKN